MVKSLAQKKLWFLSSKSFAQGRPEIYKMEKEFKEKTFSLE